MIYRTDRDDTQQSFAGNPVVASVLRENVRVVDGRAIIGLWGGWPCLLSEIRVFGKVLAITRNSHAVVGTICDYPQLDFLPCGHRAYAAEGSLEFNFTFWRKALATVEARTAGWLYSVEFSDLHGEVIHKVCLTEQSNFEAFRSWVELSQMPADGEIHFRDFGRDPCRENSAVLANHGAELIRIEALNAFFQLAAAERWPFLFIVGNDGAAHMVQTTPTTFRKDRQWIFAGDETSGVHLRVERLAEVFLQRVGQSLLLKACDAEGRLVCAIAPGDEGGGPSWNAKLRGLAEDFPIDHL